MDGAGRMNAAWLATALIHLAAGAALVVRSGPARAESSGGSGLPRAARTQPG